MAGIKDGGSAFPVAITPEMEIEQNGMSIRDFFAAQALAGIMANGNPDAATMFDYKARESKRTSAQQIALTCYELADAMIAEREKGK